MAAPSALTRYGALGEHLAEGTIDLDTDTIRAALVTSSYTPNANTHTQRSDFSANELSTGNGYTNGGAALTGVSISRTNLVTTFDSGDVSWSASGGNIGPARYLVLYADVTRNGVVGPLIGYLTIDSAPADVTINNGSTGTVQWDPAGIATITA